MTTAIGFKMKTGGSTSSLLDLFFPVGSIYQSTKATNPATFMGGTWAQLKDRFLLAAGAKAAGAIGGAENVTLTIAQMPKHSHNMTKINWQDWASNDTGVLNRMCVANGANNGDASLTITNGVGGGAAPQQHAAVQGRVHVGAHRIAFLRGGRRG